jgi:exodeoxyribonuclease-3
MLKIATWNVNSLKARKDRLLAFLKRHEPDVLCLQELKLDTAAFPLAEVADAGYQALVHGQKTYNGVAILARVPLEQPRIGWGVDIGDAEDSQARLVSAVVHGIRVLSVYVPNGSEPSSDKYQYKLRWLQHLVHELERHHSAKEPLILCGDLNIAPDDSDVARPDEWRETVLCATEVRSAFQQLIGWGLHDVFRQHHPDGGVFSWWDYRQLSFPKGNGLRIDHLLATTPLARTSQDARIDRDERKGKLPSDHAPVLADFAWPP